MWKGGSMDHGQFLNNHSDVRQWWTGNPRDTGFVPSGVYSTERWNEATEGTLPDDCSSEPFLYKDYVQLLPVRYALIVIYVVVMGLALLGNSLVIWTVVTKRHMRTVTNCYLLNLAVADLLVAGLVMPLKVLEYTAPCSWWIFNKAAMCSLLYYVEPLIVFASVLTLVAISIER